MMSNTKARLARLSEQATAAGDMRLVVVWEDGRTTIDGIEQNEYIRRPGDVIFRVKYRDDTRKSKILLP